MRRSVVVATLVSCGLALGSTLAASPAAADQTVVVPGLSFPSGDTYVTTFGCADLYQPTDPAPLVRLGNVDASPLGRRSAGVLPRAAGSATGPVSRVDSLAAASTNGFTARAEHGGAGVAWIWYVAPDLAAGEVWVGRAVLQAAPGWGYVDARGASYEWQRVEALTGRVVEAAGTATPTRFTRQHGDGPGYLLAGLGCDGEAFSFDGVQVGSPGDVTTYDVEGLVLTTTMSASDTTVPPGGAVTLTGASLDAAGTPAGTPLVLEAWARGDADWQAVGQPVPADRDGYVRTTVTPDVRTRYRWVAPETGYADASTSGAVTVLPG